MKLFNQTILCKKIINFLIILLSVIWIIFYFVVNRDRAIQGALDAIKEYL